MDATEKIGLLPGFGWATNQSWFGDSWWSHLVCTVIVLWALTPIGHVVWGFISQATVIPLSSDRQWKSFFPGDLYLGVAVALVIVAAGRGEKSGRWQDDTFHWIALTFTLVIAVVITWFVDGPSMPRTALLSPSKLYHNFLLYGGYGYVAFVGFVAAIGGNWGSWNLLIVGLAFVVIAPWLKLVADDSSMSPRASLLKQRHAHPASYKLFWVIPIKGSYLKP